MPCLEEVSEAIRISTLQNWEELAAYGWSLYKKNMNASDELKAIVREITADRFEQREKIQAILEYLQENFRYVSMNIDYHNYEPHPANRIFFNKYGDCKDQTLLAMTMLEEINVSAYPALVSTESDLENHENLLPMFNYFDHVILAVNCDDKIYFSDVLMPGYKFWQTPAHFWGSNALLLKEKGGGFLTVPECPDTSITQRFRHKVELNMDTSASGFFRITLNRETTNGIRKALKGLTENENEQVLSKLATIFAPGGSIKEAEVLNLDEKYSNLVLQIRYDQKNWAERVGDMIVFGFGSVQRMPVFTEPTRKNPIVLRRCTEAEVKNEYVIPENCEIVHLPETLEIETDFGHFKRTYAVEGSVIKESIRTGTFRLRLPADRYREIKTYYDELVALTKNRIAIRKEIIMNVRLYGAGKRAIVGRTTKCEDLSASGGLVRLRRIGAACRGVLSRRNLDDRRSPENCEKAPFLDGNQRYIIPDTLFPTEITSDPDCGNSWCCKTSRRPPD